MIYLDYAGHTPPCEAALAAFCRAEREFGNAHARHAHGRGAAAALARITAGIAALVGAKADEIVYTSGAGEGNFRAITGLARAYRHVGRHVLTTAFAHPSEGSALAALAEQGYEVGQVRICPDGKLDLTHLAGAIRPDTVLFCVSAVDSELGVVQNLGEIAAVMRAHPQVHWHIDAAQAMGKVALPDFSALGASTMVFSSHKFYGVGGSGVLLRRSGVMLEGAYDGGTPALGLAAACYAALEVALREQATRTAQVAQLKETIVAALAQNPRVRINSPAGSSPHMLNLSIDGMRGTAVRDTLNAQGVCVSVKAACATENSPSRAVQAISDKKNALLSWRVSLSHLTTAQEIKAFLEILNKL